MKIGDKVRIKSYEVIYSRQTDELSYGFYTDSFFFDNSMKDFCGTSDKIKQVVHKDYGYIYKLGNAWWWLEKWLIPEDFLTDLDMEI